MKRIADIISSVRVQVAFLLTAVLLAATSCNGIIYDDEGDCDPYYKVRFKFDKNIKWADAFPQEVNEVTLYVLDENGRIVWSRHEAGSAVKSEGYLMNVPVPPGTYTLLAWCGKGHRTSFTVNENDLGCTLLRDHTPDGQAFVNHDLDRLYHGVLEAQDFPDSEGVHIYTVPLIKNTNDVHVVLQHLSGEPVDKDDFTFTITSDNGLMAWDNQLVADEPITYYAWYTGQGSAEIYYPEAEVRGLPTFSAAIAQLTVGRLVEGNDIRLTVCNNEGETVLSVPLIDYLLLVKDNRKPGDDRPTFTDNQDYLDRQDDYSMVFLLDEGNRWIKSHIYINSWKVLLQDVNI